MRHIYHIITLITTMLLFLSCEHGTQGTLYDINIKSEHSCTYDKQTLIVAYELTGEVSDVTASTDAEWILSIDSYEYGKLLFNIAANDSDSRTANVTIEAAGHKTANITITQIAMPGEASHTLMVYFFGTSLMRYFNTNIKDMMLAIEDGALAEDNRLIYIMQNGVNSAYIREICYDASCGKCIEREIERVELNAMHVSTDDIGANISKMAKYAQADRYGIVFAGHGQAWIPRELLNGSGGISTYGALQDMWQPASGAEITRAFGESNMQVDPAELAEAIDKSGVELDYILFDACFMSNIEAIYDLRESANYIIASPCEIMGRGFPYHRTLPYLFAEKGADSDIIGAAESYYIYYRDEYDMNSRCGSVAVYDCNEIEALAETTKHLVATALDDYNKENLQTYEGQSTHQFYDFGQWANVVATDKASLAAFNAQLDNTVIAKFTLPTFYSAYGSYGTYTIDTDVYSGVTTSAPSDAYPQAWHDTNWYKYVWGE